MLRRGSRLPREDGGVSDSRGRSLLCQDRGGETHRARRRRCCTPAFRGARLRPLHIGMACIGVDCGWSQVVQDEIAALQQFPFRSRSEWERALLQRDVKVRADRVEALKFVLAGAPSTYSEIGGPGTLLKATPLLVLSVFLISGVWLGWRVLLFVAVWLVAYPLTLGFDYHLPKRLLTWLSGGCCGLGLILQNVWLLIPGTGVFLLLWSNNRVYEKSAHALERLCRENVTVLAEAWKRGAIILESRDGSISHRRWREQAGEVDVYH